MKINSNLSKFCWSLSLFLFSFLSWAQTDKELILKSRQNSNQALLSGDTEGVLENLTEDVFITTGSGTLISGKNQLRNYVASADSTISFKRNPNKVQVNDKLGLAWEQGTWYGYKLSNPGESVIGGNYSAMWKKISGRWYISSQLFVTLKNLEE